MARRELDWREVPGLPFEVSDQGHVASLRTCELISPVADSWDKHYLRVRLMDGGKNRSFYVHTLVALAFLGPRPKKHDIDHVNGKKQDNRAQNLRYLTHSENRGGPWKKKLNEKMVREIRWLYWNKGWSSVRIATHFPVMPASVRSVIREDSWKHVTGVRPRTNLSGQDGA